MKKSIKLVLIFILLSIMAGYGCSTSDQTEKTASETPLEKRVHALMKAKISGDWKQVYTFFDAVYKDKIPESRFETARTVQFKDYRIEQVEMDASGTKAVVFVKHSIIFNEITVEGTDIQNWVFENDDWFLAIQPGN